MTTKIDPSLFYENRPEITRKTGDSNLGKDEFLKILIAQLQNQDPLNPMDDREFIAQMAQFSSLEQMMNMSKSLDAFVQSQQKLDLVRYSELIGKETEWFEWVQDEETEEHDVVVHKSIIQAVRQHEGEVFLKIDNDLWIRPEQLLQISAQTSLNEVTEPESELPEDDEFDEG